MRHVFVVETAHDVHDRVHFADMRQKFIAQPFAPRRALYEARDVHEFDDGGRDLFAVIKSGQFCQPFVGHGYDAHVRLYRAERVICGFRAGMRDRVEQSGFAHVGQTYDTEFHLAISSKQI